MRGLPGSGKTTFANQMVAAAVEQGWRAVICSADRFFINVHGIYQFNRDRLADAHAFCRAEFDNAMAIDNRDDPNYSDIIIVDNTSIRLFEFNHYKGAAMDQQDLFTAYKIICRSEEEAIRQNTRSVHWIPNSTVLGRYRTFERDEDYDYDVYPIYEH
jgi:tRNA uridine 5-carbamoylmethylation protein Kti12